MIINKLEIKNFGKLHEKQVKLGAGINVVYGENESGKSTLHTFIRSMLFGVERLRGKAARTDTYNRCEPWENPTYYAGNMEFTCGEKPFLLSRNFYKETENARLVSLEDGEHLSVEERDLQMLLGGINEGIFDNTVSVGQLKCVTGRSLAEELQNYIANSESGGDVDMNPAQAAANLKEKRRRLQAQKKQEQSQQELKLRELQAKQELLQSQQEICRRKMEEFAKKEGKGSAFAKQPVEEKISGKAVQSAGSIRNIWNKMAIAWTVLAVLFLILGFGFWGDMKSVLFFVLSCGAGIQVPISFVIQRYLTGKTREVLAKKNCVQEMEKEPHGESEGKRQQMQEEWQERQVMLENLQQEQEELQNMQYETSQTDEEIEAVNYAIAMMEKTVNGMQKSVGGQIRRRTGEILSELTDGKYSNILIESDMNIRVQTIQKSIELHQLSRGTLEQVYFALRMAVSEVLCAQEPMPVIMDDVFAMYDEKRLQKALKWLVHHKGQVIILTCHKREGEILDRMGALYKNINL